MGVDVQHGQLVVASHGIGALEIVAVPAFNDNYLWLVHDSASGETAVVDPGDEIGRASCRERVYSSV